MALQIVGMPDYSLFLVALAIAPVFFLLWLFYHQDRYKRESKKLMTVTFVLGALFVFPAIFLELILAALIPRGPGIISIFIYFLVGVGLVEESFKFVSVRIFAYKSSLFDEPMDGIILGACAGLGFATVENIGYVLQFGPVDAVIRALISVPGHAFYGAIIGYYLGEAKFRRKPEFALAGLSIAIILHGVFDTVASIFSNLIGVIILFLMILVVYYGIVEKEVKTAEDESPYNHNMARKGRDNETR